MRMKELRRKSIWFHSWLSTLVLAVAATTPAVLVDAWSPQHVSFFSWSAHCTACPRIQLLPANLVLALSSSSSSSNEEEPEAPVPPKKKDIDDDDVSERFKYKVNALMGVFDPPDAEADTDQKTGNILNAMLKFPIAYAFTVVGKTVDKDDFVAAVENVVLKESGVAQNALSTEVTPRGSKFTKVVVKVTVESSDMIASIYERLQQLEQVVMHY